jgi:hypothetical protein
MAAKRKLKPPPGEGELIMCSSVEAVIRALETPKVKGEKAIRDLTGRAANNVSNWKADGVFPSNTYKVLTDALAAKGYTAPPDLWRMIEP